MKSTHAGPSGNAFGVALVDPVLIHHNGLLVLFARERAAAVDRLFFTVLDPARTSEGADGSAWNGWYRHFFPESNDPEAPRNAALQATARAERELRVAGMDIITVPPTASTVRPADAPFRVQSEGNFIAVWRQTAAGRLYLNRFVLVSFSETVGEEKVDRFRLEPSFEVRFRRSRLRDIPLDDTDTQSHRDALGAPFLEPTLELPEVRGIQTGRFGVAVVATASSDLSMLYVAVSTQLGARLFRIRRSTDGTLDYSESPEALPELTPRLASGGALTPIEGLAPCLAFYAEREHISAQDGSAPEVPRTGRLMLTLPVKGQGLSAALAVYDFSVDAEGRIPPLGADDQSLLLVDGSIQGGTFVPDTDAPYYPKPTDIAATSRLIDGLMVNTMLLGQVQPQTSPILQLGDDGLLHLYLGGPAPHLETYRWSALEPGLPEAMVAQFDTRVNRWVLAAPWRLTTPSEQPNGAAQFLALQSGALMKGSTVRISDPAAGPADSVCDVLIEYPPSTGLPGETWRSVPRELGGFMTVLNGEATDDSADPRALSREIPFYDFQGQFPVVQVPLGLPPGAHGEPAPSLLFVTTRSDMRLVSST